MNKKLNLNCIYTLIVFFISVHSFAADRYWVGTNSNKNWNTTTNWSATSGGSSGASVPGAADDVYFTSDNLGELILDVNISVRKFTINTGYSNSISQNGKTIIVGVGGMILNDGSFIGNAGNITVNGIFTLAGTNFTSTTSMLQIGGNYTKTGGLFLHNNGTVRLTGVISVTGSTDFYDLTCWSGYTGSEIAVDISSTFNVTHTFSNSGGSLVRINAGTINVQGDIAQNVIYTSGAGTGTININGNGNQLFTGQPAITGIGAFCNIKINKGGGILTLKQFISLNGTWEYVAGMVDDTTNDATISFPLGSSHAFKGTQTINRLYLGHSGASTNLTVVAGNVLTVRKSIITGNKGTVFTGNIKLLGDFYSGGAFTNIGGGGTGTIEFCGSGDQILSGTDIKGAGEMCNILINKITGTLILKKIISVPGNWIWQQGEIDASTNNSTVAFIKGTKTISGNHELYNVCFYANYTSYNTIPVADVITVAGELSFESPGAYTSSIIGGTIKALGNITITSSGFGGSGKVLIAGGGPQLLQGAATKLTGTLGNIVIDKPSGSTLILKDYINSWGNWTYLNGTIDGQTNPTSAVVFNYTLGGKTITGSHSLYNVCFSSAYSATTINIAPTTTITVDGDLALEGANNLAINSGNIDATKNVTVTNTAISSGGSATINFKGSADQVLTGNNLLAYGTLCHVKIDKSGGILKVKNKITFGGNWTHVNGTLDLTTEDPTIVFVGNGTITAKQDFYNLSFWTGTFEIPLANPITVTNLLKMENSNAININTGIINVTGNITTVNVVPGTGGGSGLININGTDDQLFTGNNLAGAGNFCNININKPSSTLTLANVISVSTTSTWRYLQGTVEPGTSTFCCMNVSNVITGTTSSFMQFYNFRVQGGNNTLFCNLTGPLYVRNNLTIDQARTLKTNNYDVTVGGNYSAVGLLNGGTSTFTFNGSGRQVITASIYLHKVIVNKPSGKIYLDYYPLNVINSLSLIKGVIVSTTSTSMVRLNNNTVVTGGSNQSFIAGPVTKIGDDAFTFPVGDTTLPDSARYHPFSITAPSTTTASYTAQYYPKNQLTDHPTFTAVTPTLKSISTCEYWSLIRNVGTSVITPTLAWNTNTCNINTLANVRVGSWDGTQWKNLGQNTITGTSTVGTINAASAGPNTTNQYYVIAEFDPSIVPNHLYWIGNGSNKNWDVASNWSATSGGAPGTVVPISTDSVHFDGGGKGRLILNVNINVAKFMVDSTYDTDTIIQNNKTITVGGGGMILKGGTFWGDNALITDNGVFTLAGTNFRSTSSKLTIVGNYTFTSGNFLHNNGKVYFTTTNTIAGNPIFYDVVFSPIVLAVHTIPVTNVLTVMGELKIEGTSSVTINTGTIHAKGNITNNNPYPAGGGTLISTCLINICGTNDQTFTGPGVIKTGVLGNVTIDKTSGTLYLNGNITICGDFNHQQGIVDAGTSTLCFGKKIYKGNFQYPYNNVSIWGICLLNSALDIKGNFKVYTSSVLYAYDNQISIAGNWDDGNTMVMGTSTVIFNGSGNQTITKSGGAGIETFYGLEINKPSGKVYLKSPLNLNSALILTKGVLVSTATNTLNILDNATATAGSYLSYVSGPLKKTGNDAFVFPLSDTTLTDSSSYHQLGMTAPASATDAFTAQYYAKNQLIDHPTFTAYASTLKPISTCEYWSLTRNVGSSTITPTLGWNANTCNINALTDARVASWNGTTWTDLGQNSTTGNETMGTVKANAAGANTANQYYVLAERMPLPTPIASFFATNARSLAPTIEWSKTYGGSDYDYLHDAVPSGDGGYLLSGSTHSSASGDVPGINRGYRDYWIVKTNAVGDIQWSKNLGSSGFDSMYGMVADGDGGCTVVGEAGAGDGDFLFTGGGTSDIVVTKLDGNGNVGWIKLIGGSGGDLGFRVMHLKNGGLLIVGLSHSATGVISGANNGGPDGVIIKTDNVGNVLWTKVIGTSGYDFISGAVELPSGDIVVSGAVTTATNGEDYLIAKLSSTGTLIWQKTYGGTGEDNANAITKVQGGFVLTGYTHSNDGDVGPTNGGRNAWTIKTDEDGNLIWKSAFGGSGADNCQTVFSTPEGGSIGFGQTSSNDFGITTANNSMDGLLVKYNSAGQMEWHGQYGGPFQERIYNASPTLDGGYIMASMHDAISGDVAVGRGTGEGLITKLKEPVITGCVNSSITFSNTSINATSYLWKVNNVSAGTSANLTYVFNTAGTYTVSLTATNGGETHTKNSIVTISGGVTADAGPAVTTSAGSGVTIGGTPAATGGIAPYTYLWNPGTALSSTTIGNPISTAIATTTYTIMVADASGCSSSASVVVTVEEIKSYAELKKAVDAGYYQVNTADHTLYFNYTEEYKSGNLNFKIYDNTHELKSCPTILPKQYGDNRFGIDLMGCLGASSSKYYLLEVINDKSEKLLLKFKY